MELSKKSSEDNEISTSHVIKSRDKFAGWTRTVAVIAISVIVLQLDKSDYFSQLSKWPRRAVILLIALALAQICSYILIKVLGRIRQG